jgi:hypothetical protein
VQVSLELKRGDFEDTGDDVYKVCSIIRSPGVRLAFRECMS